MTDETARIMILGEIKGTLNEFKEHTDRRFDEIKDVVSDAAKTARVAQDLATQSHQYSKNIVQKAGIVSGSASMIVLGIAWIIEHIPRLTSIMN